MFWHDMFSKYIMLHDIARDEFMMYFIASIILDYIILYHIVLSSAMLCYTNAMLVDFALYHIILFYLI